jgi:hypothetical protein
MSKYDDGGSAFPYSGMTGLPNDQVVWPDTGMSLRDWFAGQALPSAVGDYERVETRGPNKGTPLMAYSCQAISRAEIIAAAAYELADAMIAARKNRS